MMFGRSGGYPIELRGQTRFKLGGFDHFTIFFIYDFEIYQETRESKRFSRKHRNSSIL